MKSDDSSMNEIHQGQECRVYCFRQSSPLWHSCIKQRHIGSERVGMWGYGGEHSRQSEEYVKGTRKRQRWLGYWESESKNLDMRSETARARQSKDFSFY